MRQLLGLWHDDCGGGLIAAEWLFVFATLILGGLTGMVSVRQALLSEWTEAAQSLTSLNHGFSFSGQTNGETSLAGSSASETTSTLGGHSALASHAAINQAPMD
jgi:hypothetical protein